MAHDRGNRLVGRISAAGAARRGARNARHSDLSDAGDRGVLRALRPFWSLPTEVLPPAVAGVGIGLVNGAGNLGGTVGPYFFGFIRDWTGSFALALTAAGISLVLGSLIATPIRQRKWLRDA